MTRLLGYIVFILILAAAVGVVWQIGYKLEILPNYGFKTVMNNTAWASALIVLLARFFAWTHGEPFLG